eukprot:COSAG01_NODE_288_length_19394_cov_29.544960_19_plen_76_part_00
MVPATSGAPSNSCTLLRASWKAWNILAAVTSPQVRPANNQERGRSLDNASAARAEWQSPEAHDMHAYSSTAVSSA